MDINIKANWLKALRSGRFVQGSGTLKYYSVKEKQFQHCCLGVLCELATEAGVIEASQPDMGMNRHHFDGNTSTLPQSVMNWAGLLDTNPTIEGDRSLAGMNDGGASFSTIADAIEQEL